MGKTTSINYAQNGINMLLDSVIIIDHFNGLDIATDFIKQQHESACISAITRTEVLTGMTSSKHFQEAQLFLNHFRLIPIDADIADLAARLRKTYRWKTPDAIQAACAINSNNPLATRNTKDFQPERHEFVHIPYQLN